MTENGNAEGNGQGRTGFGPFESMRALTDLQLEGIAAASKVAERFTEMLDGGAPGFDWRNLGGFTNVDPDKVENDVMGEMRSNVARLADVYTGLFQRTFEAYADLLEARARPRTGMAAGSGGDVLKIVCRQGGMGTAEFWVHNHESESLHDVRLVPTDCTSVSREILKSSRIKTEPCALDQLGPLTTQKITVSVTVPPDLSPGRYHGHILASSPPDTTISVVIEVTRPQDPAADAMGGSGS